MSRPPLQQLSRALFGECPQMRARGAALRFAYVSVEPAWFETIREAARARAHRSFDRLTDRGVHLDDPILLLDFAALHDPAPLVTTDLSPGGAASVACHRQADFAPECA